MKLTTKIYPLTAPVFDEREIKQIEECLKSGWVTQGPMTQKFESLFAASQQLPFALATTSCTAALHMAVIALGLRPGDEVLVPAFTWITSANCAEYAGAKAVFVDVDLKTYNIDPQKIEAAITPKTKAIIVVHLFGLSACMDEILKIAKKHNLFVIEDAACAMGTEYGGKPIGALGDISCFSFHPRKVITTGEGGMLGCKDPAIYEKLKRLRSHGASPNKKGIVNKPYIMDDFETLGFNYRLSDILAAVGIVQMEKASGLLKHRKQCAENYSRLLEDCELIVRPSSPEKCGHTFQSYVIRLIGAAAPQRNAVMDRLKEQGIQTRPGTHAVHRLDYYVQKYKLRPEMYPSACLAEDTSITLPIFPGMAEADQNFIVETLKTALKA